MAPVLLVLMPGSRKRWQNSTPGNNNLLILGLTEGGGFNEVRFDFGFVCFVMFPTSGAVIYKSCKGFVAVIKQSSSFANLIEYLTLYLERLARKDYSGIRNFHGFFSHNPKSMFRLHFPKPIKFTLATPPQAICTLSTPSVKFTKSQS